MGVCSFPVVWCCIKDRSDSNIKMAPVEHVPCVDSVHQHQPGEHFKFHDTLCLPDHCDVCGWLQFSEEVVEFLGPELNCVLLTSSNECILVSLHFSYMNLVLIVQLLWSLCLACQDIFSLRNNRDLHAPDFLLFFVIIDWVSRALCHCYCPCSYT